MPIGDNRLNPKDPPLPHIDYELPKTAVEPAVRACRLFNTMLDLIFYDVPGLVASLSAKDAADEGARRKSLHPASLILTCRWPIPRGPCY